MAEHDRDMDDERIGDPPAEDVTDMEDDDFDDDVDDDEMEDEDEGEV